MTLHIQSNLKLLKHKLNKVEKIPEGKIRKKGVGCAVDVLPYSTLIPILTRSHLEAFFKRNKEKDKNEVKQKKQETENELKVQTKDQKQQEDHRDPKVQHKDRVKEKKGQQKEFKENKDHKKHKDHKKLKGHKEHKEYKGHKEHKELKELKELKEHKEHREQEVQKEPKKQHREPKKQKEIQKTPPRTEFDLNQILNELDSSPRPPQHDSLCSSSIDTLVVREVDEFAYLKNDESDEETTLTKNLKKIRSEPPPRPCNPPPQKSFKPDPPPKPSKQPKPDQTKQPEDELNLERLYEEKNWHIICVELNRKVDAFKTDQLARSVLRKSIMTLLDIDDTFPLIDYIKIAFEFQEDDTEFWEILVGKLKRKVKDHRYKCQADPMVVLNNYNIIIQTIFRNFTSSSLMSNIRLPFHISSYLTIWGGGKELAPSRPAALIQPMQANAGCFEVDLLKIANGKSVFKIKSSRRDVTFNPKLFG